MESNPYQIADGVLVFESSVIWQLKSVVVYGQDANLVVDPGWTPTELASIRQASMAAGCGRASHVVFTHGDEDHVVGWSAFDGATLVANPLAAGADSSLLAQAVAKLDQRFGVERPGPYQYPPSSAFTSPRSIDLGADTALFFDAPGHTADSQIMVMPERRTMVIGDYLMSIASPVITKSWRDYRQTLTLIEELCDRYDIQSAIPGHGEMAMSHGEIKHRLRQDEDFLDGLSARVEELLDRGDEVSGIAARLRDHPYGDQPVSDSQRRANETCVRLLLEEIGSHGRR